MAVAAEPALIDLSDPEFWQDPHPVLRAARERHPVARSTSGQHWVLRSDWVERLAVDARVESGSLDVLTRHGISGPVLDWWRLMLTNLNGPQHARLRGLVSRAFTPRAVERLRPRIREHAGALLRRAAAAGELDLVADFAHELPSLLLCDLLGVPERDRADFAGWSTQLGRVLAEVMTPELLAATEQAVLGLDEAVAALIAQRRRKPTQDLLGALVAAADASDEDFGDDELGVLAINLLFGGHDSSRSLIGVAALLLLQHPDQLERLRRDPALIPGAVEEILRYEPVIGSMGRVPREPLEVEGVTLPAGQSVMLSLVAANRDPAVFEDPDRFDVSRPIRRSMAFGWGPHHCLGASLARAELAEVLGVWLRCPRLELAISRPRWVPFTYIRRLEALPVRVGLGGV
jgi:cytochrome P450